VGGGGEGRLPDKEVTRELRELNMKI